MLFTQLRDVTGLTPAFNQPDPSNRGQKILILCSKQVNRNIREFLKKKKRKKKGILTGQMRQTNPKNMLKKNICI